MPDPWGAARMLFAYHSIPAVTDDRATPRPLSDPGIAAAEEGLVILDGPAGLAITLTASAAAQTGRSLIDAAAEAETQPRSGPRARDADAP